MFTPSEAASITGVSALTQRDWRHRGFLPKLSGGHARFDEDGLERLALLATLGRSMQLRQASLVTEAILAKPEAEVVVLWWSGDLATFESKEKAFATMATHECFGSCVVFPKLLKVVSPRERAS
jgi:hypothetical protein